MKPGSHCICGGDLFTQIFHYDARPEGEVEFAFSDSREYRRDVLCCRICGHYLSVHEHDMSDLYSGNYVSATYGAEGLRRAFDRINSLPPERSDNVGRVDRIISYVRQNFSNRSLAVLDVGSGTCVFLGRLKRQTGWRCVALDPDARAAEHARTVAGVEAVCGDFMSAQDIGLYDLITLNKVLEHVDDPVAMLAKTARHLAPGGLVYIELPDGELAFAEGPGREEFFIDHHHVFSAASLMILVQRAGFATLAFERLREPSAKFTLRAFLTVNPNWRSGDNND